MSVDSLTIALAGNPNCGKTTVFNALTGSRQRVGNWPGVTVERMEGFYADSEGQVQVVDLPGIYSFSAFSNDERVARRYILDHGPDVVVNVLDATNLERNLYLTTQILEMGVPVVVALNMMDRAEHRHIKIEMDHLSEHLGCPVIPIIASRNEGIKVLQKAIREKAKQARPPEFRVTFDPIIEQGLNVIETAAKPYAEETKVPPRWLAVKLLEQDSRARELTRGELEPLLRQETLRIEKHMGEDIDLITADGRYGFIHGLARDVVRRGTEIRRHLTDVVDQFVLNRALGIPVFIGVMYLVFLLTIQVGAPFIDFFDQLCGVLFVDGIRHLLQGLSLPAFVVTLLADGVGGGIQTVATFIPPIFFIFFCLSILEDSGYMARAAFVMDRLLRVIGLPGKAFLPMLVGFGCNVPAIMAARTLENERDRILTVLINPFMSCGARLPVYTLFAVVFFPDHASTVVFGLYLVGIALAIITGLLFKNTLLQGDATTFVMELPPYHLPTLRGILYHTFTRLKSFVLRAGQIIILAVMVLNVLQAFDTHGRPGNTDPAQSALAAAGRWTTPVFHPMGITEDNWPATVGLLVGILGKEAVVGCLSSLYIQPGGSAQQDEAFGPRIKAAFRAIPDGFSQWLDKESDQDNLRMVPAEQGVSARLKEAFITKTAAMAYLLFVLIYMPCVAVLGAMFREVGWRWAVFSASYLTALAWWVATAFYQTATFTAHPASSASWLGILLVAAIVISALLRRIGKNIPCS